MSDVLRDTSSVIKALQPLCGLGHRPDRVFTDWVAIVDASLRMLPAHARSVAAHRRMADDDAEAVELWEDLRKRYRAEDFGYFKAGMGALLDIVDRDDITDTLGAVYMLWAEGNHYTGQFFTPMAICEMMAMMSAQEAAAEVVRRISEATGIGDLFDLSIERPHTAEHVARTILPHRIEDYKPVTVYDPCCGSGTMLLAAARIIPRWMSHLGLVRYYGQDIDKTCAQMAQSNLRLYCLNGYALQLEAAVLEGREIAPPLEDAVRVGIEAPAEPVAVPRHGGQQELFGLTNPTFGGEV